ncbi:hypothetical protein BH10CYA1_BH10CYA1_24550 [soil metagenome]
MADNPRDHHTHRDHHAQHGHHDQNGHHDQHGHHEQHGHHDQHGQHGHLTSAQLHNQHLRESERHIEQHLKHNPHDFKHVFQDIEHLRKQHPHEFHRDLQQINEDLHKKGLLPHLRLIEDDHVGKHHKVHHDYEVVSDDKQNPKGNGTVVSTSRHAPHESERLRKAYHSMHYGGGHYNGFHQSAESGGGANGGFDTHAVGGHVPDGARKELIDKALELAGVPVTPENEAAVNKIVSRESSWNPNITNNWDSNARAGHPSTGLMQTIPSTFHQYALEGLNSNIHDPLSNLVAGIRYAEARYGGHGMSGVAKVASRPGGY